MKKKFAFTLVEIIITMTIVGIIVMFGLVMLKPFESDMPLYLYNLYNNISAANKVILAEDKETAKNLASVATNSLGDFEFIVDKNDKYLYCESLAKRLNTKGEINCDAQLLDENQDLSFDNIADVINNVSFTTLNNIQFYFKTQVAPENELPSLPEEEPDTPTNYFNEVLSLKTSLEYYNTKETCPVPRPVFPDARTLCNSFFNGQYSVVDDQICCNECRSGIDIEFKSINDAIARAEGGNMNAPRNSNSPLYTQSGISYDTSWVQVFEDASTQPNFSWDRSEFAFKIKNYYTYTCKSSYTAAEGTVSNIENTLNTFLDAQDKFCASNRSECVDYCAMFPERQVCKQDQAFLDNINLNILKMQLKFTNMIKNFIYPKAYADETEDEDVKKYGSAYITVAILPVAGVELQLNKNVFTFEVLKNGYVLPVGYLANNNDSPLKFDIYYNRNIINHRPLTYCEAVKFAGGNISTYTGCGLDNIILNYTGPVDGYLPEGTDHGLSANFCLTHYCSIKPNKPSRFRKTSMTKTVFK